MDSGLTPFLSSPWMNLRTMKFIAMDVTTSFPGSLASLTKNNLQPIDGFRGSSYPDPPYFASVEDKLLGLETSSKPLADNQILHGTGKF